MNITYKNKQRQQLNKIIGLKQSLQYSNDLNQTLNIKTNTSLSKDQSPLKNDSSDLLSNSLNLGRPLNTKFYRSQNNKTLLEDNQNFHNSDNILKELNNSQVFEGRKNSPGDENRSSKSPERKLSKSMYLNFNRIYSR